MSTLNKIFVFRTSQIDIVRPPDSWNIGADDLSSYSHLNLDLIDVTLHNSVGIIGETSTYKYDQFGNLVLKSKVKDAQDLLSHPISDYEVAHILSPMASS